MAKIVVVTDEGEVMDQFKDEDETIGNLHKPMARSSLMDEIREAVDQARKRDKRNEQGNRDE